MKETKMRDGNLLCRSYAQELEEFQEHLKQLLAEKESMKDDWYWKSDLVNTELMIKTLKEDIAKGEENPYYLYFVKGEEKTE